MSNYNEAMITYYGVPAKVNCDRNCNKAWGTDRPFIQLSEDEDDKLYLADDELGDAPPYSSVSEGGYNKPRSPDKFPNKWCVRQCERCNITEPGKPDAPLALIDWSRRHYNIPDSDPANQQPVAVNGNGGAHA